MISYIIIYIIILDDKPSHELTIVIIIINIIIIINLTYSQDDGNQSYCVCNDSSLHLVVTFIIIKI